MPDTYAILPEQKPISMQVDDHGGITLSQYDSMTCETQRIVVVDREMTVRFLVSMAHLLNIGTETFSRPEPPHNEALKRTAKAMGLEA